MATPRSSPFAGDIGPAEILQAKILLQKATSFPPELVDSILDHAEYWIHSSVSLDGKVTVSGGSSGRENTFLLRSLPIGVSSSPSNYDQRQSIAPQPLEEEFSKKELQTLVGEEHDILERPCRKIVFTIRSRDQGWGGNHADRGSFTGSFTWFDVGLERFDKRCVASEDNSSEKKKGDALFDSLRPIIPPIEPTDDHPQEQAQSQNESLDDGSTLVEENVEYRYHFDLLPSDLCIQKNRTATRELEDHVVEWRWTDGVDVNSPQAESLQQRGRGRATLDGSFIRDLRFGDVVTVWAKARFPGWVNTVQSLTMDVYWAI